MQLTSAAFKNGGLIPPKYTCNGENISPPFVWSDVPSQTKSFVFICEDPDLPTALKEKFQIWDHWVLYNIPAHVSHLEEGGQNLPPEACHGLNTWKKEGYGGPCPPDKEHRYYFKLFALNTLLSFSHTPIKTEILAAMHGHVLAEATLIGHYNQPQNQ